MPARKLRALRFLQTSQKKFPVVAAASFPHILPTRSLIAASFRRPMPPIRVSGTCAREEGLRTLTSPRREASLFKLGRNLGSGHFSFVKRIGGQSKATDSR